MRQSMLPEKWRRRLMGLARHVSSWSKDPSSQHGAVIVRPNRVIVGLGYNGFPRHVGDDRERYEERSVKYAMVVHAESNAILNSHAPTFGCVLVATGHPCVECAKLVIQAGISEVVCPPLSEPRFEGDWQSDAIQFAAPMLREAGVNVVASE